MNIGTRLGLCSLLAAIGFAAACTTEDASNADECTPGDQEACTCEDTGEEGTQTCNSVGSGFNDCVCGADAGAGGSGGASGGSGGASGGTGGDTGGAGGDSGGTGGSGGDSGGAGGTDMDASAPDSSVAPDGGDAEAPSPCNACMLDNCNDELVACAGDPCDEAGDAGASESDCMFVCLDDLAIASDGGADGGDGGANDGVIDAADLTECAALCGVGTDGGTGVSAATEALFTCMLGLGGGGADCRADCGY